MHKWEPLLNTKCLTIILIWNFMESHIHLVMNINEICTCFSFFHPSVSALTFYPPSLEWHEWFLSTSELLSRGNLECLRFGASIAWMRHLLFMASLDLLFFHSGFVVEDRLEPTSHIHDILRSSTKNKTTGQQQNKQRIAWILQYHSWLPRQAKKDWFFFERLFVLQAKSIFEYDWFWLQENNISLSTLPRLPCFWIQMSNV